MAHQVAREWLRWAHPPAPARQWRNLRRPPFGAAGQWRRRFLSAIATGAGDMTYVSGARLLRAYDASGNLVWKLDDAPVERPNEQPVMVEKLGIGPGRVLYGVASAKPLMAGGCTPAEVMAVAE